MKKIAIAATLLTALSSQTFAQSARSGTDPLEGFSLGLLYNSIASTTALSAPSVGVDLGDSRTSSNFALQAQYNWKLSTFSFLALGATLSLSDYDATALTGAEIKSKNLQSIYLAPGIALSDTTQLYAKLASVHTSLEAAGDAISLGGYGIGFGLRQSIGRELSLQAEFMVNRFDDKDVGTTPGLAAFKHRNEALSLGLVYQF